MSRHIYKVQTIRSEMPSIEYTDTSSGTVYIDITPKISRAVVTSDKESDEITLALSKLNKKFFNDFSVSNIRTDEEDIILSKG